MSIEVEIAEIERKDALIDNSSLVQTIQIRRSAAQVSTEGKSLASSHQCAIIRLSHIAPDVIDQ